MPGEETTQGEATTSPSSQSATAEVKQMYDKWRSLVRAVVVNYKDVIWTIQNIQYQALFVMMDVEFYYYVIEQYLWEEGNQASIEDMTMFEVVTLVADKKIPPVETCQRMRKKLVTEVFDSVQGADKTPEVDDVEQFIV